MPHRRLQKKFQEPSSTVMADSKKHRSSDDTTADFAAFSFRPPPAAKEIYAADKLFHRGKLLPCKPITPPAPFEVARRKKASPLRQRRAESLDSYTRLRTAASPDLTPEAVAGKRSKRVPCVLGVARLPAEMEMKDIKTRQRRLGPPPLVAEDGRRGVPYWGILQSLSCKATKSIAVAPASPARWGEFFFAGARDSSSVTRLWE